MYSPHSFLYVQTVSLLQGTQSSVLRIIKTGLNKACYDIKHLNSLDPLLIP